MCGICSIKKKKTSMPVSYVLWKAHIRNNHYRNDGNNYKYNIRNGCNTLSKSFPFYSIHITFRLLRALQSLSLSIEFPFLPLLHSTFYQISRVEKLGGTFSFLWLSSLLIRWTFLRKKCKSVKTIVWQSPHLQKNLIRHSTIE